MYRKAYPDLPKEKRWWVVVVVGGIDVKFWTSAVGGYKNWTSANKGSGGRGPNFDHLVRM